MPFDPDFPVLEEFLLPDWDNLLQTVDRIVTGIEGRTPVRSSNDDNHGSLSDLETAQPVNNADGTNFPNLVNEKANLFELPEGHLLIGLIDEVEGCTTFRVIPNDSLKDANRTIAVGT